MHEVQHAEIAHKKLGSFGLVFLNWDFKICSDFSQLLQIFVSLVFCFFILTKLTNAKMKMKGNI
jgi:hypothetical protein